MKRVTKYKSQNLLGENPKEEKWWGSCKMAKKDWKDLNATEKKMMIGGFRVEYMLKKNRRISYETAKRKLMEKFK